MKPLLRRLCTCLAPLALSACANHAGIAPTLTTLEIGELQSTTPAAQADVWPRVDWWREFADAALAGLIDQALADNPDLQATRARLARAAALAEMAAGERWPRLDATAEVTRMRFTERGQVPPPFGGTTATVNEATLDGLWELDFFGKNREALQAALGSAQAAAADHQAARILLASDVARRYVNVARLLAQRSLLQRHIGQQRERHELIQRRHVAGIDPRSDLDGIEALLAQSQRDLAAIDGELDITRHALAALLGKAPEALAQLDARLPALTTPAPAQPLRVELLGHRADVAAARWRVEAAEHQRASARAAFYPNIDLRAFVGYSSIGTLDHWFEAASRQPGVGIAFNLPIFDAGRLRAQYRTRSAETDLAIAGYNATLLNALRDVADELSTLQSIQTQLQRQHAVLTHTQRTLALSSRRHAAGISDRLEVLAAEAQVHPQLQQFTELQARWFDTRIRLIRALGGGYTQDANPPPHSPTADGSSD